VHLAARQANPPHVWPDGLPVKKNVSPEKRHRLTVARVNRETWTEIDGLMLSGTSDPDGSTLI